MSRVTIVDRSNLARTGHIRRNSACLFRSRNQRSHVRTVVSAEASESGVLLPRRALFLLTGLLVAQPSQPALAAVEPALINPSLAPNQALYDPTDADLRKAAALLQKGLNATDVEAEEAIWSEIISKYGKLDKPWVPDVVGRAWGNRGNARSRQGKLEAALSDYNTSIEICPWSVDPVLNRGVVLEALGRFEEAIADYRAVLAVSGDDPAAWNNLGNATAGTGDWKAAVAYYGEAVKRAPEFAFAVANRALAMYESGQRDEAMREMRTLLRRYPDFDDMRAALTSALWALGKEGDAETNWQRVDDIRYKDLQWLKTNRRWPPSLVSSLSAFLSIKSV